MTDKFNDPQETELSEAEKRARRIRAIRSAIHDDAAAPGERENGSDGSCVPDVSSAGRGVTNL